MRASLSAWGNDARDLICLTRTRVASRSARGNWHSAIFSRRIFRLEDARFDVAQKCANIVDSACAALIEQNPEQFLEIATHRNDYGVKRVAVKSHDRFIQPLEAVPDRGVKDGGVKCGLIIPRGCGSVLSANAMIIHRKVLKVLYVRWVTAYRV